MTTEINLRDLIEEAKETLVEVMDGGANSLRRGHPSDDTIVEVADGAVPVYTYDLITVYRSSPSLWGASPDIVMDRDTGVDAVISRAIYEEVQQALFEYARELGEEPIECTVDDCGQPDDHLDTDGGLCTEHCGECDECEEEEEE